MRYGGQGLGNLLFPWARALIYARSRECDVEWPIWPQYFREAWRDRHPDKRTYATFFRRPSGYAVPQWFWETRIAPFRWFPERETRKFREDDMQDFEECQTPATLLFDGLGRFYRDFPGWSGFIWDELKRMSRFDLEKARARGAGAIGVHVRRGDFIERGWATSIGWFLEQVRDVRRRLPDKHFVVFCDEGPDSVVPLLEQENTSFSTTSSNALLDLAHMSGTDGLIVGRGSTFAGWAIFFGRMPTMFVADEDWPRDYWSPFCRLAVSAFLGEAISYADHDEFACAVTSGVPAVSR